MKRSGKDSRKDSRKDSQKNQGKPSAPGPGRSPTLDLHGFRVDEVFDAVEAFLLRNANQKQVRIMPGKGTGKVKSQVIDYLKQARYPWSHETTGSGAPNEGVMIVHMD